MLKATLFSNKILFLVSEVEQVYHKLMHHHCEDVWAYFPGTARLKQSSFLCGRLLPRKDYPPRNDITVLTYIQPTHRIAQRVDNVHPDISPQRAQFGIAFVMAYKACHPGEAFRVCQ
jgi:hypothetical protein